LFDSNNQKIFTERRNPKSKIGTNWEIQINEYFYVKKEVGEKVELTIKNLHKNRK